MYYIYHIPGVKIGCSKEPEKRIADQGYTDYEILEQHEDIFVASDREIELQKEHGYRVDRNPYWQSLQNRHKWNSESCAKAIETKRLKGNISNSGLAVLERGTHNMLQKTKCPHCNKTGSYVAMKRWHFDNCKHKE